MKIIQVIPFFGMGGAEIMCETLVYELKRLGHDVIVVSLSSKDTPITERLRKAHVDIRFLDKKEGLDISILWELAKLFRQEQPDVIHSHLCTTKYVFPVAVLRKIKVVHTVHSIAEKDNGKLARILNRFCFRYCHVTPVALSELVRTSIINEYGISKEKVPVIYNGIDLSKCWVKTHYPIDGNYKILHIGRFVEAKNHMGLLAGFALFHEKHPNSELWLIGVGETKAEAESYVAQNGLASSVRFLGLQSNVYGYLHDADMFTLPSNYEGMPMTLIEAMGTGLPIVATAVGGVPDMLDESCAKLVPVDTKAIADAFEAYYLNDDLRKEHGKKVQERSRHFSAEAMAEKYAHIYQV